MKKRLILLLLPGLFACSSKQVRNNPTALETMNLNGQVKTLTEFTSDMSDTSAIVRTTRTFDINGRQLSEEVYRNDQLVSKTVSSYDQRGNKTQDHHSRFADDPMTRTYEYRYDKEGRALRSTVSGNGASLRTALEHDESGRLREEKHFGRAGELHTAIQYSYNAHGQLSEKKVIRLRGLVIDRNAEGYEANGHCWTGSEKARNEAGANYYSYAYTYNEKGHEHLEKCLNADGSPSYELAYVYGAPELHLAAIIDAHDEFFFSRHHDTGKVLPVSYAYCNNYCLNLFKHSHNAPAFDIKGNWTIRHAMDKDKHIVSVTRRIIEYY